MSRPQLLALGFTAHAINHRLARGRLHPIRRGVYAVGRFEISQHGRWMAAVLSCGTDALLTHASAAALWMIRDQHHGPIEIAVRSSSHRRHRPGIRVHRRASLSDGDITRHLGIPVTSPLRTLMDLAIRLMPDELEAAVNEANGQELIDPEVLRAALDERTGQPGVKPLRRLMDRRTFRLTDSALERLFLPIVRRAGLPMPDTRRYVNGFKVDFYWPTLGLVVETDGLRYHRTPAQQARDRLRDQAHTAAGLIPLRFTHAQVRFEAEYVQATLSAVANRISLDPR